VNGRQAKPRVFARDVLDPVGLLYARETFDLVHPGDEGWERWREEAVGLLVISSHITAQDIEKCKKLKYIARHGVGYDNIDAPAARARNIAVTNCPGINVCYFG
jgi:D-3-phosphoglycerate dehydrogenase